MPLQQQPPRHRSHEAAARWRDRLIVREKGVAWLVLLWGIVTIAFVVCCGIAISMLVYRVALVLYGLLTQGTLCIVAGRSVLRQKAMRGRWLLLGVALIDVVLCGGIYFSPPSQPLREELTGLLLFHAVVSVAIAFCFGWRQESDE